MKRVSRRRWSRQSGAIELGSSGGAHRALAVGARFARIACVLVLSGVMERQAAFGQSIGEPLPSWSTGILDIHQIHTGRGNAALLIFPDGTSLLVDAGDGNPDPPRGADRVPDASRTPGEWIARYAKRRLPADPDRGGRAIDYALSTHFHGDHMGGLNDTAKRSTKGDYRLTGFTDVAEHIPIRTMLDRGWPDYDYPRPLVSPMMDNYRAFLDAQRERHGMKVERLEPGLLDQIVPTHQPDRYPGFAVRNVAVNGEVWTGVASTTRKHFPPLEETPDEDWPTENQCSMAIRVSYGRFDYYTGGDMPGQPGPGYPEWQNIERPVARAAGPADAAVLSHHGLGDGTTEDFVRSLRARVWVIPSRAAGHPDRWVLNRILSMRLYPGPRDVFSLTLQRATLQVVGRPLEGLASRDGHIVIRVAEGGDSYQVLILDAASEYDTVKAIHGPYTSR